MNGNPLNIGQSHVMVFEIVNDKIAIIIVTALVNPNQYTTKKTKIKTIKRKTNKIEKNKEKENNRPASPRRRPQVRIGPPE